MHLECEVCAAWDIVAHVYILYNKYFRAHTPAIVSPFCVQIVCKT